MKRTSVFLFGCSAMIALGAPLMANHLLTLGVQLIAQGWRVSKTGIELTLSVVFSTLVFVILREVLALCTALIVALSPKGPPAPYDKRYAPPRCWTKLK